MNDKKNNSNGVLTKHSQWTNFFQLNHSLIVHKELGKIVHFSNPFISISELFIWIITHLDHLNEFVLGSWIIWISSFIVHLMNDDFIRFMQNLNQFCKNPSISFMVHLETLNFIRILIHRLHTVQSFKMSDRWSFHLNHDIFGSFESICSSFLNHLNQFVHYPFNKQWMFHLIHKNLYQFV